MAGGFFKTLMNHKILAIIVLGMVAMVLIGAVLGSSGDGKCVRDCDSQGLHCKRECGAGHCVDGDDWGYPKFYISAQSKDLNINPHAPLEKQYAEGIDSGQILLDANGQSLEIKIAATDQWTSWWGGEINPYTSSGTKDTKGFDGGRDVPNQECLYWLPPAAGASPAMPSGKQSNTKISIPTASPISSAISSTSTQTTSPRVFAQDLSPTTLKLTRDTTATGDIPSSVRYNSNTIQAEGQTKAPQQLGMTQNSDGTYGDVYADPIVPCYIRYGMGLYVGLAPNNGTRTSPEDVVLAYHIPDSKRPDYAYDGKRSVSDNRYIQARDGLLVNGMPANELPGSQTGDRLYFKIVDNAYIDNDGGYNVAIPAGTRNAKPGPLEQLANIFITPMNYVVERLYNGIVTNSIYVKSVQAALGLYIVFYGFLIMMGGLDLKKAKQDIIYRLAKMCLVFILISPGSWDFFYNYFFKVFLGGTQEIAAILVNPFGDYDPSNPWYSLDQLLHKLWSAETWSKISSTLMSNHTGILFIFVMLCVNIVFIFAVVRALCIFLISYASICMMIVLFPIFLVFILFDKLKAQIEALVNQLVVFAIQQILLFAALGMFAAIIIMFLERTIGYHTCWNVYNSIILNFGTLGSIDVYDFKYWMPDITFDDAHFRPIWVDGDGDGIKEMVTRYVDLPYFDPILDKDKISSYSSERNFISLADIVILACAVFLMYEFMNILEIVASALKSTSTFDSKNIFSSGTGGGAFASRMQNIGGQVFSFGGTEKGKDGKTTQRAASGFLADSLKLPGMAKKAAGDFAKSDGGKFMLDSGKSAGNWAGQKLANTKPGMAASLGMRSAGSKMSNLLNNASAAKSRLNAMGLGNHEAQGHENSSLHHEDVKVNKRGADIANTNLTQSISKFGKVDTTLMDYKKIEAERKELAKPIMEAMKNGATSNEALAMMANLSRSDMKKIHAELSSQLNDATNPAKLSKDEKKTVESNLERLQKGIDAGTVRGGIKDMQDYKNALIQDTFGPTFTQATAADVQRDKAAAELQANKSALDNATKQRDEADRSVRDLSQGSEYMNDLMARKDSVSDQVSMRANEEMNARDVVNNANMKESQLDTKIQNIQERADLSDSAKKDMIGLVEYSKENAIKETAQAMDKLNVASDNLIKTKSAESIVQKEYEGAASERSRQQEVLTGLDSNIQKTKENITNLGIGLDSQERSSNSQSYSPENQGNTTQSSALGEQNPANKANPAQQSQGYLKAQENSRKAEEAEQKAKAQAEKDAKAKKELEEEEERKRKAAEDAAR